MLSQHEWMSCDRHTWSNVMVAALAELRANPGGALHRQLHRRADRASAGGAADRCSPDRSARIAAPGWPLGPLFPGSASCCCAAAAGTAASRSDGCTCWWNSPRSRSRCGRRWPGRPGWVWVDCALGWTLLTLAWIDWTCLLLPDVLTLPLLLVGLRDADARHRSALTDHCLAAAAGLSVVPGPRLLLSPAARPRRTGRRRRETDRGRRCLVRAGPPAIRGAGQRSRRLARSLGIGACCARR